MNICYSDLALNKGERKEFCQYYGQEVLDQAVSLANVRASETKIQKWNCV